MSVKVSVIYFSGYGHTAKVANAVFEGAKSTGADVSLINVVELNEEGWARLDNSDAIIFGSPTYMGSVAAKLKEFMEVASERWMHRKWVDKIAAGFTNGGGLSGDKLNSLTQLYINAMQHGMIWVGCNQMGPMKMGQEEFNRNELNRLGSFSGLMTQSNNDTADFNPPAGDLETAKGFGQRIANITAQFVKGR
ncbi:MAG: flavodoxin family protein [Candidatus Jidaibacter sp.]|jgi:NAD(P)H dehydrogenase (quinone)|nr:flavodoxin family protein [Candidatus Jidaibacter sp.]